MTDGTKINNLFIPSARTTNYGLKQIKVNGPRIWNTLPNNIKNSSTLHAFLSKLRLHYISEYRSDAASSKSGHFNFIQNLRGGGGGAIWRPIQF